MNNLFMGQVFALRFDVRSNRVKDFLRYFRNLAPPVHVHQGGSPIHRVTCGHVCLLFVMGTDQFGGDFRGKASSIVFMIAILMIYDFNLLGID